MACFVCSFTDTLESLLLVIALSLDAYGTNRTTIPVFSIMVVNGSCAGMLAISLCFGSVLKKLILDGLMRVLCFAVLLHSGNGKAMRRRCESIHAKQEKYARDFSFLF